MTAEMARTIKALMKLRFRQLPARAMRFDKVVCVDGDVFALGLRGTIYTTADIRPRWSFRLHEQLGPVGSVHKFRKYVQGLIALGVAHPDVLEELEAFYQRAAECDRADHVLQYGVPILQKLNVRVNANDLARLKRIAASNPFAELEELTASK